MKKINALSIKNYFKTKREETSVVRWIIFIVFLIYAFVMVYALTWAVLASLKTHVEFILNPNGMPQQWALKNYLEAFEILTASGNNLFVMIFNSLWITFLSSLISLTVCTMSAYIMAKYEFIGKKVILFIIFTAMMVPLYGSTATLFKLIYQLGIYDSPLFLIKSASGLGTIFFILRSYFMTLPNEYMESAQIDGAGDLRIFIQIMVPMAVPSIMSLMLIMFVSGWNDYMTPIMYLPSYPTLASGLYVYEQIAKFNMNKPVYFSGVIMCAIVPLVIFAVFREKFMTNISIGGLKG